MNATLNTFAISRINYLFTNYTLLEAPRGNLPIGSTVFYATEKNQLYIDYDKINIRFSYSPNKIQLTNMDPKDSFLNSFIIKHKTNWFKFKHEVSVWVEGYDKKIIFNSFILNKNPLKSICKHCEYLRNISSKRIFEHLSQKLRNF